MRVLYAADWGARSASTTASVIRYRGLVQALELGGIDVIRAYRTSSGGFSTGSKGPRGSDLGVEHGKQWRTESVWDRARRKYFYDEPLSDLIADLKPDYVIVGAGIGATRAAIVANKTHGVPSVLEISDWYDLRHVPKSSAPQWLINEVAVRNSRRKAHKAIVISDFLSDYYRTAGCETLVVPPLFAPWVGELPVPVDDGRIRICFAGVAASKDAGAVINVVRSTALLDPTRKQFRVDLVGTTEREVHRLLRTSEDIPAHVQIHPRMPHLEAAALVARCDFTVIQRPARARYAKAGFPSKVAESLMLGTPVIGNLTSDLSRYLVHGSNAIVLRDETLGAMVEGLEQAVAHRATWGRGQVAAEAEAVFSPGAHAERIRGFLFQ